MSRIAAALLIVLPLAARAADDVMSALPRPHDSPTEPAAPPAPVAVPAKTPPTVQVAAGKGLTVTSGDGRHAITLRTRIVPRFDVSVAGPDQPALTRANINTARIWVQGHVFDPKLQYVFQIAVSGRDYREGATSPIFDAFIDWKAHRDVSLKVGQYIVPFDRLRTVREFALQMTDRPRPVGELTLDRDVGFTLYSNHLGADRSPVAYHLGVFGGGGTNLSNPKPAGALFVGRLELRPLGDVDDDSEGDLDNRARPGLALGGGFAYNLNTNRQRSTTGTVFTGGTADYLHAAADLTFKWQGLALQGAYLLRDAAEDLLASTDAAGAPVQEWARSGQGWVAQGSCHFKPGIEIVARGSQIYALPDSDPKLVTELETKRNEVAAGLNWYKNGHRLKVQTTWIALFGEDFSEASHTVATQVDAMF